MKNKDTIKILNNFMEKKEDTNDSWIRRLRDGSYVKIVEGEDYFCNKQCDFLGGTCPIRENEFMLLCTERSMRSYLKRIKVREKKMNKETARCPKCNSTNISQYRMMTGPIWCNDCGFRVEQKELDHSFIVQIENKVKEDDRLEL